MSTYLESFLLFILCASLYPSAYWDALHIAFILLLFAIYCIELITQHDITLGSLGIVVLILCFFIPELSVCLPLLCYVFFYRQSYLMPCLYLMPMMLYLYHNPDYVNYILFPLTGLCFYFAHQNRRISELQDMVKSLRDSRVEMEMILNRKQAQLIENQNKTIYIATLKERNRIAREIHDNVGHMLSRSILQVGALLTICKEEAINVHLNNLKSTLDDAMNSIRSSVHNLHDESIDLTDAIHDIVRHFTFCPTKLECDLSRDVPKEIKYCFLAILKEALNNIIKHSNATTVSITVREHPGFYQILIEDNGTKLSDLDPDASGIGLSNMKDRVDALHGILHISADHGFRIFASVPKSNLLFSD